MFALFVFVVWVFTSHHPFQTERLGCQHPPAAASSKMTNRERGRREREWEREREREGEREEGEGGEREEGEGGGEGE